MNHFQNTGNKKYILVLADHFETRTPGHRQQIVHLGSGAPLQDVNKSYIFIVGHQDTGNKRHILGHLKELLYIFMLGHHSGTTTQATPLRAQDTGNRPRQRQQRYHQQIVHFCAGAPRKQRQQIVSFFDGAPLGNHQQHNVHFRVLAPLPRQRDKDTETNLTYQFWGIAPKPRHQQKKNVHLSSVSGLRFRVRFRV